MSIDLIFDFSAVFLFITLIFPCMSTAHDREVRNFHLFFVRMRQQIDCKSHRRVLRLLARCVNAVFNAGFLEEYENSPHCEAITLKYFEVFNWKIRWIDFTCHLFIISVCIHIVTFALYLFILSIGNLSREIQSSSFKLYSQFKVCIYLAFDSEKSFQWKELIRFIFVWKIVPP